MRTWIRIQAMAYLHYGYEVLTFILAPTGPTNLRLRRSVKWDGAHQSPLV